MVKAVERGAAAVITKTIVNEIRPNVRPRVMKNECGLYNIELYSDFSLEHWEKEIAYAKSHGVIVIGNILGHSASELTYTARKVESYGVDAIEISLFSPHGEGIDGIVDRPERLYELTKSVVDNVKIPVMVKLSANVSNVGNLAKEAKKAGAAALSGIDTVRAIPGVNLRTGKALLPTYGGYSGDGIRPISLAAVASMAQATNLPVSGVGGISKGSHVLEFIMLGANTIQLCSSVILNGYEHVSVILREMEEIMKELNIHSLEKIRGVALESLSSFEEIANEPLVARIMNNHRCDECTGLCKKACLYEAIDIKDGEYRVIEKQCTGCGLCPSVCPFDQIDMVYSSL